MSAVSVGKTPSTIPLGGGDPRGSATSAPSSAEDKIQGGHWTAPSKDECDKGYSACDKETSPE